MSEQIGKIFTDLVKQSWVRYDEVVQNRYLDDMPAGAVIASTVEIEYSLIDLNSDGTSHYLRFEHLPSKVRLIFQLTNLSENLIAAKVLGRHARVAIGYGVMVNNFSTIWNAVKAAGDLSILAMMPLSASTTACKN